MRNTFEQQTSLDIKPIAETPILLKSRDSTPSLVKALLTIYTNEKYRSKILQILEDKILAGKKNTGRKGLNLWQIFVLAQFRLGLNLSYDRLHSMVFSDKILRQLIGIEYESGFISEDISYQRIIDNVQLLDDETLRKINEVVVSFGHDVFKKKEGEALRVKTDSFVVESNVHFPTDYNLLWDSSRKAVDTIAWFTDKYPNIKNWRKLDDWYKTLKNLSRAVGQASSGGGKDKSKRMKYAANNYLTKAIALRDKLKLSQNNLPTIELIDLSKIIELERFIGLMDKHIDLVYRRIIKGEKIPHQEKLFSIFEEYTEWIKKGKRRPSVELGKKLSITTDQFGLIIDSLTMEHESDSQIVQSTADRVLSKFSIKSWSFDKGYWHKENKELLSLFVEELIMPKKGKPNKQEKEEEHTSNFKKLRNKHSAVESNINELEHRGLDRCPDKGFHGFKRYIGIAIVAYNLRRIGKELINQENKQQAKYKKRNIKSAA
jgi:hypothetical protein